VLLGCDLFSPMATGFPLPAGVPVIPADEIVIGARYASGASGYVCGAKLKNQPVVAKVLGSPEHRENVRHCA
jgi:hypothetical protein